jgi:hypothetical protein
VTHNEQHRGLHPERHGQITRRTTSGAANYGLGTAIKYFPGATGIALGTTVKYLRRTASAAAGISLDTNINYLRGAAD